MGIKKMRSPALSKKIDEHGGRCYNANYRKNLCNFCIESDEV